MKVRVETSLFRSPLTGQILSRISFVVESPARVYYAIKSEGYAIDSIAFPAAESPQSSAILRKLTKAMEERETLIDTLFLASDFDTFRNGRPAPIACACLEAIKNSVREMSI